MKTMSDRWTKIQNKFWPARHTHSTHSARFFFFFSDPLLLFIKAHSMLDGKHLLCVATVKAKRWRAFYSVFCVSFDVCDFNLSSIAVSKVQCQFMANASDERTRIGTRSTQTMETLLLLLLLLVARRQKRRFRLVAFYCLFYIASAPFGRTNRWRNNKSCSRLHSFQNTTQYRIRAATGASCFFFFFFFGTNAESTTTIFMQK